MWVPSVKKANLLFTRGQIENGCFENIYCHEKHKNIYYHQHKQTQLITTFELACVDIHPSVRYLIPIALVLYNNIGEPSNNLSCQTSHTRQYHRSQPTPSQDKNQAEMFELFNFLPVLLCVSLPEWWPLSTLLSTLPTNYQLLLSSPPALSQDLTSSSPPRTIIYRRQNTTRAKTPVIIINIISQSIWIIIGTCISL